MGTLILPGEVILQGPVTNIAAAGAANAAAVYQISNFNQQVGTKSMKLVKLLIRNNGAGNDWVFFGTGVGGAFVAMMPAVLSLNNMDGEWLEAELPQVEWFADMTAYPAALPGGGSVDIQVTVAEIG